MLRGLWRRRWLSLALLVVAAVTVASASLGPLYAQAARTAVLRNALDGVPPDQRGWRVTTVHDDAADLARAVSAPYLRPPVLGAELLSPDPRGDRTYPLMWQDGQCGHVTLIRGRCPRSAMEIMVTRASGFRIGDGVKLTSIRTRAGTENRLVPLRVVGVYRADPGDDFWFGRNLFTQTAGVSEGNGDPLLTVPETRALSGLPPGQRTSDAASGSAWTAYAIVYTDPAALTGADLDGLEAVHARLAAMGRSGDVVTVFTRMADTLDAVRRQIGSLSVPVTLVTLQLVALGWLLLFLTVRDLAAARAPETALARLRGLGTARMWAFGLSEPVALLLAALPIGLAAGWVVAARMAAEFLRGDVPVTPDGPSLLYGPAAAAGGLLAAAAAARGAVTRPVVEQWRRTPRARRRTWIPEAVVIAVAAVGLVELLAGGPLSGSPGGGAGALLAPGLLALASALLARRLLPLACAALFRLTRSRGGIAPFLAVRQIARGGATGSTVIVLGPGLGLAVFAVAAWSVTSRNFAEVARVHNGAETVYVVRATDAAALRRISDAIPDSAPVVRLPGPPVMLATDPARFAAVALWRPSYAGGHALEDLVPRLAAPVAPRVPLSGERIRVRVLGGELPAGWTAVLYASVRVPGQALLSEIPLARPRPGRATYEWGLPRACRTGGCELRGLRVETTPAGTVDYEHQPGDLLVTGLDVRRGDRWTPVDAGLGDRARWRPGVAGGPGLVLSMSLWGGPSAAVPATYPDPLPALADGTPGNRKLPGLDDAHGVGYAAAVSAAAVPGLDAPGGLVDLELADRAAYGYSDKAEFQIWAAPGRAAPVLRGLRAAGVPVLATRTVDGLRTGFAGQGPGLALILLVVAAGAAAVLALGRAVLALYVAARRRTLELAALEAAGARTGPLRRALLIEQAVTLTWASLAGVLAGVLAARVALPRMPEFTEPPSTPALVYTITPGPVVLVGAAALVACLVAAAVTAELLLRGVRVERLREAPA
ncbi:FtsX-like permease family protein [Microbispora sp. ATCC PTA-5024]|uniref:FtsX-like permease family protein n=1 Tax=Microbispora sp. ATCC PTA-5024 TaxID=316330 RepID=UPI0012EE4765|nr:FtsX-like permease family protein [Microbispora sp. ATCC PTA-5024]